jgi:branched-subunit amino acid transport protein
VLAAILVSSLLSTQGHSQRPGLAASIAVAAAFVAVRRTGNLGWALIVGLPAAWIVTSVTAR